MISGDVHVPYATWEEEAGGFRAQAMRYAEVMNDLRKDDREEGGDEHLEVIDRAQDLVPCPDLSCRGLTLRDYQSDALERWKAAGGKGVVVLPTGAGKTVIAMKAIEMLRRQPTIVIVPTLELLEQWRKRLADEFGLEVGAYGGGETLLRPVTVATYDSAYLRAGELGNRFGLIVFDEVHHLPAESFKRIAESYTAPYRLGLTATFEREDRLHAEIPRLTGDVVYRLSPRDLAGRHLSDYTLQRLGVGLTPQERLEYERNYDVFRNYVTSHGLWLGSPRSFQRLVLWSGRDKEARRALLARNRAVRIALNSEAKMEALGEILASTSPISDRVIVFTRHNDLVRRISRRFLLPSITHATGKAERREILSRFRDGRFCAIVTSKVLDEGIDVPEASVGVIVSGTGSPREFVQRLGRLLRKREGKRARLVEIVSKSTAETRTSWRRKRDGQASSPVGGKNRRR